MAHSAVMVHAGGNLPAEVTSFVGRRRELTDAKRALSRSRLVTLTGVGGVGKTRVAERVARDRRRAYPHGVWLVELAELSDPALLTETVLTALGVLGEPSGDALEALIDSLTSRHLLLVLDNCEHLLDEVAALTAALLRSCPDLQILATSRAPLRVVGEAVVSVPPMAVPDPERSGGVAGLFRYDAVALFTERATAAVTVELIDSDTMVSNSIRRRFFDDRTTGRPLRQRQHPNPGRGPFNSLNEVPAHNRRGSYRRGRDQRLVPSKGVARKSNSSHRDTAHAPPRESGAIIGEAAC